MNPTLIKKIAIVCLAFVALYFIGHKSNTLSRKAVKESVSDLNDIIGNTGISKDAINKGLVTIDTTVMARAGQAIQDLKYYKDFIDNAPFPILAKELDVKTNRFKIIMFNESFARIFLIPNNINPITYLDSYERDNWPDSLATEYERQDFFVLNGKIIDFDAPYLQGDKLKQGRFIKWSDGRKNLYLILSEIK